MRGHGASRGAQNANILGSALSLRPRSSGSLTRKNATEAKSIRDSENGNRNMPNMDAIRLLTTRYSDGRLAEPAPDDETLALIFQAALRAPDHCLLRPYRFFLIRGPARDALGQVLADALRAAKPSATPAELEAQARKALRAPLIIAVSAHITEHAKVPAQEQILAAGAAAHSILLALHATGYCGIWRTGPLAYDDRVRAAFGLSGADTIIGFLYVGTAQAPPPQIKRPDPNRYVTEWRGPVAAEEE